MSESTNTGFLELGRIHHFMLPTTSARVWDGKNMEYSYAYKLSHLLNKKIKVESPKPKREGIQCRRCQGFGHSETNCTLPLVCPTLINTEAVHCLDNSIVASTLEGSQLVGMGKFERKREAHHVMFCITILSFPTVISHIPINGDPS